MQMWKWKTAAGFGAIFGFGALLNLIPLAHIEAQQSPPVGPNVFVELSKKVVPSVVNISTLSTVKSPYVMGSPDDLFRRFFEEFFGQGGGAGGGRGRGGGLPFDDEGPDDSVPNAPTPKGKPRRPAPKAVALGSGFIIDAAGIILTNNHVVADADEIKLRFTEIPGEKPADGEVIGRDPELDVALIRVKGEARKNLIPAVLGDSDRVEIGEYVLAIGNPFGQGHSVTHGIISQKGRITPDFPLATYIQTDAPINPGNSGGPLVNLKGEVIAINNAIEARAQGIGFAIPINVVKRVLSQLKTKGKVSRGYIGVLIGELNPEIAPKLGVPKDTQAPFVTQIFEGGPADKAGVKTYDLITQFNGKKIQSGSDLVQAVTAVEEGVSVPIHVLRNGVEKKLSIKIGNRPVTPEGGGTRPNQKQKEKEKEPPHPDTGMSLMSLTPELAAEMGLPKNLTGVLVSSTEDSGTADRSGLTRGDVILEVDQKPVKSVKEFYSIVREKKQYLLRVRRSQSPNSAESYLVLVLDLSEAAR